MIVRYPMAQIVPFRGMRYNPDKVHIKNVATKPYDKISPQDQADYYAADPYNIVRLILGKEFPADSETDNRYTRSAAFYEQWQKDRIFIREDKPALYLYDQTFSVEGSPKLRRRAFAGLGRVVPYEDKVVFPHEKTLSGPKKDRLLLTKATNTQFGHVFMLYNDPELRINTMLDSVAKTEPLYSFTDKDGVTHMLWAVTDDSLISAVCSAMADKQLLIADGHHRYETALNLSREIDASCPFKESYNYHMMSFVNINDPGLVILPTHRVVKNVSSEWLLTYWKRLGDYFDIRKISGDKLTVEELKKAGSVSFGVYKGNNDHYILTLKPRKNLYGLMSQGKPSAWYTLPVAVLHELILESFLGIDKEKLAAQTHITYVKDIDEGISLVDDQSHQLAFFVTPTPIDSVCAISFAGETMPQKTTDFYPKIYTGLVFNKVDEFSLGDKQSSKICAQK